MPVEITILLFEKARGKLHKPQHQAALRKRQKNPQTLSNQGVAVLTLRAIDGARTRLLLALKIR